MSNNELQKKIEAAQDAVEVFLRSYTEKMDFPVRLLNNTIESLLSTEDQLVRKAHLKTTSRMLDEMDKMLIELMEDLQRKQGRVQ